MILVHDNSPDVAMSLPDQGSIVKVQVLRFKAIRSLIAQKLRYIYEKQATTFSLNYKALFALVQVLDKTVKELKPEWR
ncbi:MAG: hypothetical protein ACOYY3_20680, partial [Chloroflexota bacterium]